MNELLYMCCCGCVVMLLCTHRHIFLVPIYISQLCALHPPTHTTTPTPPDTHHRTTTHTAPSRHPTTPPLYLHHPAPHCTRPCTTRPVFQCPRRCRHIWCVGVVWHTPCAHGVQRAVWGDHVVTVPTCAGGESGAGAGGGGGGDGDCQRDCDNSDGERVLRFTFWR